MPKVSVSLPADVLEYVDNLGPNRSRSILTILEEYRERKKAEELARAYDAYAALCLEDDADWWSTWEAASARDLEGESSVTGEP